MNHFTVAEFWRQQPFAYIETYSFNRRPKSAELYENLCEAIAQATRELQQARYMQQAKLRQRLRHLEAAMQGGEPGIKLSASDAPLEAATQKIAVLNQEAAEQLRALLLKAGEQEAYAGCLPIYRDALVFCNAQNQRVQVLNVCFECLSMVTDGNQLVEADFATYDALKRVLIELGHPIES